MVSWWFHTTISIPFPIRKGLEKIIQLNNPKIDQTTGVTVAEAISWKNWILILKFQGAQPGHTQLGSRIFGGGRFMYTLPETNIAPKNGGVQ